MGIRMTIKMSTWAWTEAELLIHTPEVSDCEGRNTLGGIEIAEFTYKPDAEHLALMLNAPELLDTLKRLLAITRLCDDDYSLDHGAMQSLELRELVIECDAVIAKAEGK